MRCSCLLREVRDASVPHVGAGGDVQDLAGDVSRPVRGEERDRLDDVVGGCVTPEWCLGQQALGDLRVVVDELRARTQLVILSDTFLQFATPLMRQLDWPTLFCHHLEVRDDVIVNYHLRQPDQKRKSVAAFQSLNYRVIAAGDAYNDTSMLAQADKGILFRAPENVIEEFPQFPAVTEYDELMDLIFD